MTTVRKPAVAGYFYPDNPAELKLQLERFLDEAPDAAGEPVPKAIIAPHAGYIYSGAVAASAYARLRHAAGRLRRVVLLGPAHRIGFRGVALANATRFETPLGQVAVDAQAIAAIRDLPQVLVLDAAHAQEHSLEVHLPFLQTVVGGEFGLVPLAVGEASPAEVAEVIARLWGGDETLIVVSSDLSHYHDYATAQQMDSATSRAIERLRYEDIGYDDACGRAPICGLLYVARERGLAARTIDLRNSGDTAGARDQVVGYGSYVLTSVANGFSAKERATLLAVARAALWEGARGCRLAVRVEEFAPVLRAPRATFVTLELEGALRGCVGALEACQPLVVDTAANAYSAGYGDPRFQSLLAAEVERIDIHISVLSAQEQIVFRSEAELLQQLRPGIDGLVIREYGLRGTFLPQVWEFLPEPRDFLEHLKHKAGLPSGYWSDTLTASRYTIESIP